MNVQIGVLDHHPTDSIGRTIKAAPIADRWEAAISESRDASRQGGN